MLLESFAVGIFSITEFTKTQHYKLQEDTKDKILNEGLYHFTSKEVSEKIVKDGYFRPTKGRIRNHFGKDKVYMFAGLPDMKNFSKNLPSSLNPFVSGNLEFSAVKVNPNEGELSNFKERLQDSAIVYEGRYDISQKRSKAVELVIDLDKEGKCVFREKTREEKENGYVPKQELLNYINEHKINKKVNGMKILFSEVKAGLSSVPKLPQRVYKDFSDRSQKRKEIKEFIPYSFEYETQDDEGKSAYSVSCNDALFSGDKKLNRVNVRKLDENTGEISSYDICVDGHLLNLGMDAAAVYLNNVEKAIENNELNKVDGAYYAGQPYINSDNGEIYIGVDDNFDKLLEERNMANSLGTIVNNSNNMYEKAVKNYYRKHPIKKIMNKIQMRLNHQKLLPDRNNIGKYTNTKLKNFSQRDVEKEFNNKDNAFIAKQEYDFEYKNGSDYSVILGDTVNLDGKILRKVIISEENYLNKNAEDTVRLPRNYYIDDMDFSKIDKKDLANYFAGLDYKEQMSDTQIENNGFIGKYVGGARVNDKGRIKQNTYDESISKKYGNKIEIKDKKLELDMSEYTYEEKEVYDMYLNNSDEKEHENDKVIVNEEKSI